jgi:aspartate/methionine/tyrosine aminotransferase
LYRYSGRLSWTAQANSFSKMLAQKRLDGAPLLDLTISNPTDSLSAYPHAAIASAFGSIKSFDYHPEPLGQIDARAKIASWYARRAISVPAAQLALTASTSEAYSLLFKLLLNGGEEVLIPTPSYPLFEYLAQLEGVELRPYRLLYDGSWHVDFESLERALTPATRAIVVVNPNNPTGSFLKEDEVVRLEEIALARGLPLIADEVFMDYAFAPSPNRVASLIGRDRVLSFSLNGLSKSAGMPQMKLGWMAVNGPRSERDQALQRLELLLDTYLSVATPVQNALGALLHIGQGIRDEILDRLLLNRKTLDALPGASGVHALHCEGGWSAAVRVPNIWPEESWIMRLLDEHSVVVQPGYFFDMPMDGCLLVSLLTEPAVFAEGLERVTALARTAG